MKIRPAFIPLKPPSRLQPKAVAPTKGFAEVLKKSLGEVNELQLTAERLDRELALGKLENVHEATVAAEKAAIALELAIQIRNKVIDAYQEISRMTV